MPKEFESKSKMVFRKIGNGLSAFFGVVIEILAEVLDSW